MIRNTAFMVKFILFVLTSTFVISIHAESNSRDKNFKNGEIILVKRYFYWFPAKLKINSKWSTHSYYYLDETIGLHENSAGTPENYERLKKLSWQKGTKIECSSGSGIRVSQITNAQKALSYKKDSCQDIEGVLTDIKYASLIYSYYIVIK